MGSSDCSFETFSTSESSDAESACAGLRLIGSSSLSSEDARLFLARGASSSSLQTIVNKRSQNYSITECHNLPLSLRKLKKKLYLEAESLILACGLPVSESEAESSAWTFRLGSSSDSSEELISPQFLPESRYFQRKNVLFRLSCPFFLFFPSNFGLFSGFLGRSGRSWALFWTGKLKFGRFSAQTGQMRLQLEEKCRSREQWEEKATREKPIRSGADSWLKIRESVAALPAENRPSAASKIVESKPRLCGRNY